MTTTLNIRFRAVDTLYFRGSRPHSAAGASALTSEFPPQISTFTGAVRTRLGDAFGIDWKAYANEQPQTSPLLVDTDITELLGKAEDTGLLAFSQPKIYWNEEPLFPVPAVLLQQDNTLVRLRLGSAVRTDLGNVRLPELPEKVTNAKPLEGCWVTEKGLKLILQGNVPSKKHIIKQENLVSYESRLGIGRDNKLATVESGLLYQTEHLRLSKEASFSMQVTLPKVAADLLQADINQQPLQRFGGEGRMAELSVVEVKSTNSLPVDSKPNMLMLLTDMLPKSDFSSEPLPGFIKVNHEGIDCWEGELAGISLRLLSVVAGKSVRYGGWDLSNNKPKTMQSFVPAGTCFFIETLAEKVDTSPLNGLQIGRRTDAGFGTIICAR